MFKAFQNFSIAARSEAKCRRTIISSRYSVDKLMALDRSRIVGQQGGVTPATQFS